MPFGPAFGSAQPDTYAGYVYSLLGVISEGARLAFSIPLDEVWRGWCGLQTPPLDATSCIGGSGYGCQSGPTPGVESCADDQGRPISSAQANLCGQFHVCQCRAGCCDAATSGWVHTLELHRRSDGSLEGSIGMTTPIFLDPVR